MSILNGCDQLYHHKMKIQGQKVDIPLYETGLKYLVERNCIRYLEKSNKSKVELEL